LIFANDIKIKDYINKEGDYTEFIMRVLNAAIRVTHSNEDDSRDRTVREIFTQFNEQLFWTTQQQDYHSIINLLGEEAVVKQEMIKISELIDKESPRNDIVDFFDLTLERNFSGLS
jgi:dipeptide/tripeptide permease